MSLWKFYGETYYDKKDEEYVLQLIKKIRGGLNDKEFFNLLNNWALPMENLEETLDLVCTEGNDKFYVTGFYFLTKNKDDTRVILDGIFMN